MDWKIDYQDFAWVRRGNRRKRVLSYVANQTRPVTPTAVSRALALPLTMVSETLSALRARKLVTVLNPDAPYHREYEATTIGKQVAMMLEARPRG